MECSSSSINLWNISNTSLRTTGSNPLVGSSNINSLGLCASATAISNFFLIPFDMVFKGLLFGKSNSFK